MAPSLNRHFQFDLRTASPSNLRTTSVTRPPPQTQDLYASPGAEYTVIGRVLPRDGGLEVLTGRSGRGGDRLSARPARRDAAIWFPLHDAFSYGHGPQLTRRASLRTSSHWVPRSSGASSCSLTAIYIGERHVGCLRRDCLITGPKDRRFSTGGAKNVTCFSYVPQCIFGSVLGSTRLW